MADGELRHADVIGDKTELELAVEEPLRKLFEVGDTLRESSDEDLVQLGEVLVQLHDLIEFAVAEATDGDSVCDHVEATHESIQAAIRAVRPTRKRAETES